MIGFLLGAGFSKALHNRMPLMSELLSNLDFNADIPYTIQSDLEQTLSYLWTNYPWNNEIQHLRNQAIYLETIRKIYEILSKAEYEAWLSLTNDNTNWRNIGWQSNLSRILAKNKDIVTVTMNYDTLLERLMIISCETSLNYPAPLQRLHGIWNQREDLPIGNHSTFPFINIAGNSVPIYTYPIKPRLYKLHGSLSWYSLDPLNSASTIYTTDMNHSYAAEEFPKFDVEYGILSSVIVPPVADKSSMYSNKVLRSQWLGALNDLSKCKELYIVGYSFPKSDLAMRLFLAKACTNVNKITIVSRNANESIWIEIKDLFSTNVKFTLINGEECVAQMTEKLMK